MRLQRYMAMCAVASRRKCEEIIQQGRVRVNDEVVTRMGVEVDEEKDRVYVDGQLIEPEKHRQYVVLYKPVGVITSMSDPEGRQTVGELLTDLHERVFPVGRLDYDTEGLLILTNDGDVAQALTHPSREVEKEYLVMIRGYLSEQEQKKLARGVVLDDGHHTSRARLRVIEKKDQTTVLSVIVHEGHNRLIRRMFETVSHPVISLRRVRVGQINLGHLHPGQWRHMSSGEISYMQSLSTSRKQVEKENR